MLAVHADPADQAIGEFDQIAAALATHGIPVPRVLAIDKDLGWVLQSHAGTRDLTCDMSIASRSAHYETLIDLIIAMQGISAQEPVASVALTRQG